MSKAIIHANGIPLEDAMERVRCVIGGGMVSGKGTARGAQYCYYTTFKDGAAVSCTKHASGTFTFNAAKGPANENTDD